MGANDAALQQAQPSHHVGLAEFSANLEALVAHVRAVYGASAPPVVLITPPPVDEAARVRANHERFGTPTDAPAERRLDVTAGYAAATVALSARLGCPVLDAFTSFQQDADWRSYLDDGLHFAPAGDAALHAALLALIEAQLPSLAPAAIPYDTPEWADFEGCGEGAAALRVRPQPGSPYIPRV